jgi:hypothetical protein
MRRLMVLLAILAGVSIVADPALAGTVTNSTGSNMTAQVVWGTGDESGGGHYGGIYGDIESWGTIVGLWEQDAQVVTCDNGTPADPDDDFMGYVGTLRFGEGGGDVSVAANLGTARVTGVLTITTVNVDYCAGIFDDVILVEADVPVLLELVATSRPMPSVNVYHERVASVYNYHQNSHMMSRYATGTALLGGAPFAFDSALISHNHWTDHSNGH